MARKKKSPSKQNTPKPKTQEQTKGVDEPDVTDEVSTEDLPAGNAPVMVGEAVEVQVEDAVVPEVPVSITIPEIAEAEADKPDVPPLVPSPVVKPVVQKAQLTPVASMFAEHKAMMQGALSKAAIQAGAVAFTKAVIAVHTDPTRKNLDMYLKYVTDNSSIVGNIEYVMEHVIHNGTRQRASVGVMHSAFLKIARCIRSKSRVNINMTPVKQDCTNKSIINYLASKV